MQCCGFLSRSYSCRLRSIVSLLDRLVILKLLSIRDLFSGGHFADKLLSCSVNRRDFLQITLLHSSCLTLHLINDVSLFILSAEITLIRRLAADLDLSLLMQVFDLIEPIIGISILVQLLNPLTLAHCIINR